MWHPINPSTPLNGISGAFPITGNNSNSGNGLASLLAYFERLRQEMMFRIQNTQVLIWPSSALDSNQLPPPNFGAPEPAPAPTAFEPGTSPAPTQTTNTQPAPPRISQDLNLGHELYTVGEQPITTANPQIESTSRPVAASQTGPTPTLNIPPGIPEGAVELTETYAQTIRDYQRVHDTTFVPPGATNVRIFSTAPVNDSFNQPQLSVYGNREARNFITYSDSDGNQVVRELSRGECNLLNTHEGYERNQTARQALVEQRDALIPEGFHEVGGNVHQWSGLAFHLRSLPEGEGYYPHIIGNSAQATEVRVFRPNGNPGPPEGSISPYAPGDIVIGIRTGVPYSYELTENDFNGHLTTSNLASAQLGHHLAGAEGINGWTRYAELLPRPGSGIPAPSPSLPIVIPAS